MNPGPARPTIRGVLFDLDGTLLDTALDLIASANWALEAEGLPRCPVEEAKPYISGGARTILGYWLVKQVEQRQAASYPQANVVDPVHEAFLERLMDRMLEHYQDNLARHTCFFDGMERVLETLEDAGLPWGIVTNKQSRFTDPLAEALKLTSRTHCIISGDTTAEAKPHPLPLLTASERLGVSPEECVYIGDAARDIEAGKRAGMATLAALYGYIAADENIGTWGADDALETPGELLAWIGVSP